MVLIRPRGNQHVKQNCARAKMQQVPCGTGATKRRQKSKEARAKAKMEQEQSKCDRTSEQKRKQMGTLHQNRVRQRRV